MKLLSVNVGTAREWHWGSKSITTAIDKKPTHSPLQVRRLNVEGDQQVSLKVHGGAFKAVYGYPAEHYESWRSELPELHLPYGSLGENLTTSGLTDKTVCIGDQLRFGSAVLQVTQPRMPCFKLQFRFQRKDILDRFVEAGRHGFYFSV